MKNAARITSKGQITVPGRFDARWGWGPVTNCSLRKTAAAFMSGPCEPKAHLKNIAASGALA